MKKRIVALSMLALLLLGMLGITGCGSTGGPSVNIPDSGFDTTQEVTITFGHTMGQKNMAILDKYIKKFNEIYPNIKIEHTSKGGWGDIADTIKTEINGGTQPNIVYCYPDHVATYNLSNVVITLDDLINSTAAVGDTGEILGLTDAQKADFIETYYNEGKVFGDGKMYTMPFSKSTEVLFFDKDFFEDPANKAKGLKVPTTWEELWEACRIIKTIDPNCIPLGYDSEANWFITMAEQLNAGYTDASKDGDDRFTFVNDKMKDFIKELRTYYYDLEYFTTQEIYGSYTSGLFTNQDPSKARAYMCIGSTGGTVNQIPKTEDEEGNVTYAFEVGIAPLPQADASNKKAISQGPSLCILKGKNTTDQQVMASWLFVKFMCTDPDFQAEYSTLSGYMPVLKSVTENKTFANWLNDANGSYNLAALAVKIGMQERDTYFTSDAFNGSSKAREEVGSLLIKCISTPTQSLDQFINTAFNDALDECIFAAG